MSCGIATLKKLKSIKPYKRFNKVASKIKTMLLDAAAEHNIDLQVNHFGSMINPFFTAEEVTDFRSAQTSDTNRFKIFFWNMMQNGVFLPPSQFEAWFLSTALTKNDLEKINAAIRASMKVVADKTKNN